jgi:hypothetical protein
MGFGEGQIQRFPQIRLQSGQVLFPSESEEMTEIGRIVRVERICPRGEHRPSVRRGHVFIFASVESRQDRHAVTLAFFAARTLPCCLWMAPERVRLLPNAASGNS